jgi:hypothetical protein
MVCLAELQEAHVDGAPDSNGIPSTGLDPADPQPILPDFQIQDGEAKGRTYCLSLRNETYSNELKDLISNVCARNHLFDRLAKRSNAELGRLLMAFITPQ